ncbi:MAG: hypothetical protein IT204_24660 [Fimbriimonadaceae bacterium]|nr:hypothetical protein [Fimbriimonadaceae bacterium]
MSWLTRTLKTAVLRCGWEIQRRPDLLQIRRVGDRAVRVPAAQFRGASGLRLNLGCGFAPLEGYVNIDVRDLPEADFIAPVTDLGAFPDGCASEVRMDAVYEHLYHFERPPALAEWYRVLAPGGELHLNWIPDFELTIQHYLNRPPGLTGEWFDLAHAANLLSGLYTATDVPEMLHKGLFTKASVQAELESAGFVVDAVTNPCYTNEPYPVAMCAQAHRPTSP